MLLFSVSHSLSILWKVHGALGLVPPQGSGKIWQWPLEVPGLSLLGGFQLLLQPLISWMSSLESVVGPLSFCMSERIIMTLFPHPEIHSSAFSSVDDYTDFQICVCVCMQVRVSHNASVEVREQLGLVLSCHLWLGFGDQTWVVRPTHKRLCPLSHLTMPSTVFLNLIYWFFQS